MGSDHDPLAEANSLISQCREMISEIEGSLIGAKAVGNP